MEYVVNRLWLNAVKMANCPHVAKYSKFSVENNGEKDVVFKRDICFECGKILNITCMGAA